MRLIPGFFPARFLPAVVLALAAIPAHAQQPAPPVPATSLVLPHFAFGGGWATTFIVMNLDTRASRYTLTFRTGSGTPMPVPFLENRTIVSSDTLQGTIQPGQSLFITTQGSDDVSGQGLALLMGTAKLGGMAVLQQSVDDRPDYDAAIPFSSMDQASVTVPFDNKRQPGRCPVTSEDPCPPQRTFFSTGIAVGLGVDLRVSAAALIGAIAGGPYLIDIAVNDETGASLVRDTMILRPNGQTAFPLADLYPQTAGRRGSVTFTLRPTAASNIMTLSSLALRFTPNGGFTSLQAVSTR